MSIDSFGDGMVKNSDGTVYWVRSNEYHREDGPAIIESSGWVRWYINGKQHREDGPAVFAPDGTVFWFLEGLPIISSAAYQKYTGLSDNDMAQLVLTYGPFQ